MATGVGMDRTMIEGGHNRKGKMGKRMGKIIDMERAGRMRRGGACMRGRRRW